MKKKKDHFLYDVFCLKDLILHLIYFETYLYIKKHYFMHIESPQCILKVIGTRISKVFLKKAPEKSNLMRKVDFGKVFSKF